MDFLGLSQFLQKEHLQHGYHLTALTQYERKEFVRSSECDAAFEKIMYLLVTAPLLHPPNMENSFFICG